MSVQFSQRIEVISKSDTPELVSATQRASTAAEMRNEVTIVGWFLFYNQSSS